MRLLLLLSALFSLVAASLSPVIKTTSGHVRGFSPSNGVTAYLGVPYASPPTGPLRFHPPHLPEFKREIINATAYSYSCYQFQYKSAINSDDSAAFPRDRQNEDCLYLNIWTPAGAEKKKKKKVSTMLWLHGGGWVEGTASADLYSGEYLVSNNPDIIVVTINYRLGIFGYPYSPLLTRNVGLLDQRFAIEWTHKNIAAFGGDPDKITLFGESAGSGSISTYAYAYPYNPLVRAVIMQSGTAELISDPGPREFLRVAGNVGCKGAEEERVKCMMAAEAGKIQDAVSPRLLNGLGDGSGGVPGVDNVTAFSPEEVVKRGLAGKFARLAWGVQNNTDREERASRELMRMWTAFVKDPTEGLEKRGWRKYSEKGKTLVEIFPNEEVTVTLVESGMFDKGCESLLPVNLTEILITNGTGS
ncbi:Carboxylesterase family-domain-containing protein [Trichophaea hybrida]|nr:Carboxylesterase family-domain-containing protein [Trichophaea hybrida]